MLAEVAKRPLAGERQGGASLVEGDLVVGEADVLAEAVGAAALEADVGGEAVEAAGVSGVEALEGVGVDDERELGQLRPKGCLGHGTDLTQASVRAG